MDANTLLRSAARSVLNSKQRSQATTECVRLSDERDISNQLHDLKRAANGFSVASQLTSATTECQLPSDPHATSAQEHESQPATRKPGGKSSLELVVLGIAQDAGFPQAGCHKRCCTAAWNDPSLRRHVACLGLIDHHSGERWLIDCTPDFPSQLRKLDEVAQCLESPSAGDQPLLDGILLTHAHIGHYTGLVHLGREVMGARNIPVYAMPRMTEFLKKNGPWSQLVKLENIELRPLQSDNSVRLNARLTITPFLVPHRDEFSETVGYKIMGPGKTVMFLPDIDKWSRWDRSIETLLEQVDLAYLDGTFFENGEIPGRDMAQIPHPFVAESINRFSALDETQRKKVRFIHFNHTNPVFQADGNAKRQIEQAGMAIACEGELIELGAN